MLNLDYKKVFPDCSAATVDVEVFKNWWCAVLSNAEGVHRFRSDIRFDASALKRFLRSHDFVMGYNITGFDAPILKMMIEHCSCTKIYEAAQMIIEQRAKWWEVLNKFCPNSPFIDFGVAELMPVKEAGGESVALKYVEAHTGAEVFECRIAFDKDELTEADKQEILRYCENDVAMTERIIFPAREAAVKSEISLAKMCAEIDKKPWQSHLQKSSNSKSAAILGYNNIDYSTDEWKLQELIIELAKRFQPKKLAFKEVYRWFAKQAAYLDTFSKINLDNMKFGA